MGNASESTELEQAKWRIGKLKNKCRNNSGGRWRKKKFVLALLLHLKLQKLWPQSMVSG